MISQYSRKLCSGCWNLALPGSPKRKQIGRGAAWAAALRAARSRVGPAHQVVQPVLQRIQGHTHETGALRTHGQWTDLFYIRTDIFFYLILVVLTDVECTPRGPLLLLPSFISSADVCVRCWATCPYIHSFPLVSSLLTSDYDKLGLRIEGESPMALPTQYLVSRYKSALSADA